MKYINSAHLFVNGFIYIFGLEDNPFKKILIDRKKISDSERIKMDWVNVGKDIKKAYENEISNSTIK